MAHTWGLRMRGIFCGHVPTIRTTVFVGLHWDPPIYGNCHMPQHTSVSNIQGLRIRASVFQKLAVALKGG